MYDLQISTSTYYSATILKLFHQMLSCCCSCVKFGLELSWSPKKLAPDYNNKNSLHKNACGANDRKTICQ